MYDLTLVKQENYKYFNMIGSDQMYTIYFLLGMRILTVVFMICWYSIAAGYMIFHVLSYNLWNINKFYESLWL